MSTAQPQGPEQLLPTERTSSKEMATDRQERPQAVLELRVRRAQAAWIWIPALTLAWLYELEQGT